MEDWRVVRRLAVGKRPEGVDRVQSGRAAEISLYQIEDPVLGGEFQDVWGRPKIEVIGAGVVLIVRDVCQRGDALLCDMGVMGEQDGLGPEMRMDRVDLGISQRSAEIGAAWLADRPDLRRIDRRSDLPDVGREHLVCPGEDAGHGYAVAGTATSQARSEVSVDLVQLLGGAEAFQLQRRPGFTKRDGRAFESGQIERQRARRGGLVLHPEYSAQQRRRRVSRPRQHAQVSIQGRLPLYLLSDVAMPVWTIRETCL